MMLAIGERYRPIVEKSLIYQGVEPLWIPDNPLFDSRISAHADLNLAVLGKQVLASRGLNSEIVNLLTNRRYALSFARKEEGAVYPRDAGLCVCDTGEFLLANPQTADPAVLELFSRRRLVCVKQGYTGCSVCVADSRSIITSDPGVAEKAAQAGLEVLKIRSGYIDLPGFDTGFIGGASIRLAKNKIAFAGSLDTHPDGAAILDFLHRRGQKVVFLKEGALLDLGSGLTLP